MGGLSFSKSKTSSEQNQQSDSFGYSLSGANSSSVSGASSAGRSAGTSSSRDSIFSSDLLRQLYGGALDTAGAIDPGLATKRIDQLFTGGSSIIDSLGGGAGSDYLERRLSGDNSDVLNAQIDAVGSDLGRFFNDQLNPAITGSAVAAGQLGGGRQGVAQGEAMSSVLKEFASQSANLRAADITNRDSAALGLLDRQNQAGATALGALPQLAAIGTNNPGLDVFSQLSDIFGAPTVTNEASSQQFSEEQATEFAQALADEFGISYDEAHSLLTSKSKGKSIGGGVSIGAGAG
jgi:hypothetical protein